MMKATQLVARLVAVAALVMGAQDSVAIGDSGGGCSFDSEYARILGLGSIADVESHVSTRISRRAEYLDRQQKRAFQANPALLQAWRDDARRKMLHEQVSCDLAFPLDYAVGAGNLELVRWLLDSGVDPNGRSADGRRNVFTRCNAGGYGAPVGLSNEQALARRLEAYRMLVERGANIHALDPFHAIYGCLNKEMLPLLKQLGARVTPEAFRSRVSAARSAGGNIREPGWAVVAQLAAWQAFDFRGTSFEADLLGMLEARSGMSDYGAVLELTRRLTSVVRLSPGIDPGQPARPEDIPGRFAPTRERCFFPEIGAHPNFEFQALWREPAPGLVATSADDVTEVRVGKTKAPVLLALVNNRDVPTTWRISRSADAHVLGVIVLANGREGRGSQDALSFDPQRPAFLGAASQCDVLLPSRRDRPSRNELKLYWPANPATRSYNPFRLRGEPTISVSEGGQFVVGEVSTSALMTSWPSSRRVMVTTPERQDDRGRGNRGW